MRCDATPADAIKIISSARESATGVYFVRTDFWYIERAVWLVAGVDVLLSSALALAWDINWIFSIIIVAAFSINVALTGFCVVGNILMRLGIKPLLGDNSKSGRGFYFMQTDKWFLERYIYLFVGTTLTIGSLLAKFYSKWWLIFPAFVGTAMLVFAFTGFCIMAHALYRLGKEPRLRKTA